MQFDPRTIKMRYFMLKAFALSQLIKGNPGRVYQILTLVLVAGTVLWTSWNLIGKLWSTSPDARLRTPSRQSLSSNRPAQPPASAKPLSAYTSIAEKNPFGIVPAASATPKVDGPPPPPPLELLGTIAFGNQSGFAILKEAGQETKKVYKIGDSVSGGRTLMQVSRNMVILKKGEEFETLHARTRALQSLALQQGGEESRQKLEERNALMKNLSNVIDQSLISPHFTDGKMDGFIIGKVSPDSPLKARGFESGDLLQGINNKIIKEPDDVFLLQSLKKDSSGRVSFNIKRQGRPMVLDSP